MRILVTGSSGHVGGEIAARLKAAGHDVVGLSRRLTKRSRMFSGAIAADIGQAGCARTIAGAQPRCDAIVHAAAASDFDLYAPEISLTNGLGTQQMLELAAVWEVESFVFLSSVPLIGVPVELPVTEEHPVDPPTAYHASKLYGEQLVTLAGREGLNWLTLRLTSPIGPGMPEDRVVSVFVRRALAGEPLEVLGAGTRGQDYVDVRDVAAAIEAAIARRTRGLLNLGSGRCVSNLELAQRCVQALGSASDVRLCGGPDPLDDVRWEVSIARARESIGHDPTHSLEDSIASVAEELCSGTSDG